MTMPSHIKIKLPLLRAVEDGQEYQLKDFVDSLADHFSLTAEERNELLPSGRSKRFYNRCGWAQSDLKRAGLLESPRRGNHKITNEGREALSQNVEILPPPDNLLTADDEEDDQTPEESIEQNYGQIRERLVAELLEEINDNSPRFFEELVIDLLVRMGYGGSRLDAETVGRSGDGGIDGVINEDKFGLDVIYVQAKRWEQNVGVQPVRDFIGALQIQRARKGIFITTSKFSSSAKESVSRIDSRDSKVVLIDGNQLAQLMMDYNVGVSTEHTYQIKRVDSDYFDED